MAIVLRYPSSSSSSYSMSNSNQYSNFSYDVFLSFQGEDTRKTFTDHLYSALNKHGIRTFRDDNAMERGRLLKPELEKAIQQSQVSLIVFSKNYANSKWCLDEVLMIMEAYELRSSTDKREVVPVFYNIKPTDVRNQTGCFEEAFKGYEDEVTRETDAQRKKELSEKVEAWRASLRKAGSLSGMVLTENGYEAEFITNIINGIKKKVDYNVLYIEGKLVGMKINVLEIESWLQDPSPNSTILFIDGMGGIGKTTLAKCIYNMNCREYDGCCFLADVNEKCNQSDGMLCLQRQLLSTILKSQQEDTIWSKDEGTIKVANAICNKKVLIVLDDVTTFEQLETLLGPQRFYHGSKVIITTRHTWLSTWSRFKVPPMVLTITPLSNNDSVELFSLYAFPQNQPTEPYYDQSELVNQVIRHCQGLPLALKVLGSYLCGKSIAQWKDAMSKLEKYPHPGYQNVLLLSYESLEDENDKKLFLHIACFFVGEDKEYIVKLLAECNLYPIIGIKNLIDRCLLFLEHEKIGMHQLIRKMGQEVVRLESPNDLGKRSRLWRREDCIDVLQENVGTKRVEGFRLDMKMEKPRKRSFEDEEMKFKIRSLEKMKNMMLLQLSYVTFSGKYKKFPKKLRLLRWHRFSLKSIPQKISLEKLVVLDMSYSKLKRVWDEFKFIKSLKILNLSYSVELIKTPDFDGLPGLEWLILKGCTSLTKVHESIAYLKGLVLLDVTDCRSLRNVPLLPRSLVSIQMSGCPNLGAIRRFQCFGSTSLPSHLVKLNISYCNLVDTFFPDDWSNLVSLKDLIMDGNKVTCLPKCIQSLPRIRTVSAAKCSRITSVGPPRMDIKYNKSLVKVQVPLEELQTTWTLKGQKQIRVEGNFKWQTISCPNLGAVGGIQVLVKLNISYCNLFDKSFPDDWSNLYLLTGLNIDGNNVTCLPLCIQSLPRLEYLEANFCSRIKSVLVPKTLKRLYLQYNKSLVKVQVPRDKNVDMTTAGSKKFSCIEGRLKWQTMDKVERKIIQNLGLQSSNAYGDIDFKPLVVFEYGIFSTCVTEKQIPSGFFMYKEKGPQIACIVPSHHHQHHRIISGFTLCLVFSPLRGGLKSSFTIELYNKTKDLGWRYTTGILSKSKKEGEKGGWLSVWRCDNLLHAGDEIFVRVLYYYFHKDKVCREVEECRMNLIYDDDEEEDVGERKEGNDNLVISEYNDDDDDIIRWSDKVDRDISDYVHSGKKYHFRKNSWGYSTGFVMGDI